MKFKYKWKKLGNHIHVDVYSAVFQETFVHNGKLVFNNDEFVVWRELVLTSGEWEEIK